ncbi:hypothetical protein NE237_002908 [Protea cynaroides]|uniref:Uncharacterized protein n=1 Tax=Protea cynaroides TaxID=273540 RepID=A0A9Q0QS86_9MAGN|nr:hypothetical protein NE237_002908 [Protea cynaroides]
MSAGSPDEIVVPVDATNNQSNSQPRIQRVPSMMYEIAENRRCYEPMVVSIGPFHHGRHGTERMEQLKIKQEQQFISDIGSDRYPAIYQIFDVVAREARDCYDLGPLSELSNDVFKRMMFRDGCFILYYIYSVVEDIPGVTRMKRDQKAYVMRDLFLLENQLPFIVLKELMCLRFDKTKFNELITKFIQWQTVIPSNPALQEDSQPLHLLDLYQNELCRTAPSVRPPLPKSWPISQANWPSFRSVAELKASGIECERSTTCSLEDIKFKSGINKSYLLLPPIIIDDLSKPKFLNLVAYETCPDAPNDFTVSTYISFLNSLIDSTKDVKELRSKGILRNVLGSDQQVADLFNNLTIGLVSNSQLYRDVKWGIERHYRSKTRIWMADMRHTYFHNPWSAIAFAAALLALLLTMIQTYYAIFPRDNNNGSSNSKLT